MTAGGAPDYPEDVGKKAEWFHSLRGRLTGAELVQKRQRALAHLATLRASRAASLDPRDGALAKGQDATLRGAPKRARAAAVPNPAPSASDHFASASVQVTGTRLGGAAVLKLRPLRGASSRLDLKTARVFVHDARLRRWNLVERSGFNARQGYLWARVHRDGTYAAIALPKKRSDARRLALERFAHSYLQHGIESGVLARAEDYFDPERFALAAIHAHDLSASKADRARLAALTRIHAETLKLRKTWPRHLPNGGRPEWYLIEALAQARSPLLAALDLDDLAFHLPEIFQLSHLAGRWHPLGPQNVNGRVKSIAIHPTNGSVLYAGAADGGVWKTTDGGASWRSLWTFQETMSVGSVAIAESAPDTVYVATGEDAGGWGPSYGGAGVYKTTDGGDHWALVSGATATLGARCAKVLVHPSNPDVVYLASETGIHRSDDGAAHFTSLLPGHATDLVMAHDRPDTLYAGLRNDGLYRTDDGGASWTRITSPITIYTLPAIITVPFPTGAVVGWIKVAIGRGGPHGSDLLVVKLGAQGAQTYASSDGGASWHPLNVSEFADYDEWTSMVAIHPRDERRVFVGGVRLRYSPNGYSFGLATGTHSDHHQVVFHPTDDDVCYCCCDGGVYRSSDRGATWAIASGQLTATQLMSVGVSRADPFLVGGATQDQGIIQTTGAMVWEDTGGGGEWGFYVVDPENSANLYIAPGVGWLRRSTDGGHSWNNPTQGLTDTWASQGRQTRPAEFLHLAIRPGDSSRLIAAATIRDQATDANGNVEWYGPFGRIYFSQDHGQSWAIAYQLAPIEGGGATRVVFAPSNALRAYAATWGNRILRSDLGGEAGWYEPTVSSGRLSPGTLVTGLAVHPLDPDVVYATTGNTPSPLYRTVDGGAHWESASGADPATALPDIAASAVVLDPENPDILYVATDLGVFRSNDAGATWFFANDSDGDHDLPKVIVTGLAHHPATGRLFASTMGRGLYFTYTSGFRWLRVLRVSYLYQGALRAGIQWLEVTDGAQTFVYSRAELIRRIEAGTFVYTEGADGSRAEVVVMEPDRDHPLPYVKTTPDQTLADNLASLPRF